MKSINKGMALCAVLIGTALSVTTAHAEPLTTKTVRLASLTWEPYVGQSLPNQGYAVEVAHEAFALSGYTLKVDFYPWARALMLSRSGKVDGIFPEYWGAEREKEFQFSDGFPGGPVGFYQRKKSAISYQHDPIQFPKKVFSDLKQYRFGVVRGYLNTPEFDAMTNLKKDSAVSDEMNLRKLQWGRVDLVFIDRNVANHLLETNLKEFADELAFIEPALANRPLYVAFSRQVKRHAELTRAFNQGLGVLRETGRLEQIRAKHRLRH